MIRYALALVLVVGFSALVDAQDKPVRRGLPPELMVAEASERGGKVVISLTAHFPSAVEKTIEVERDGKKEKLVVTANSLAWTKMELVLDGKVFQAVDQDNRPLESKEVLKRLKKATPVAVYRYGDEDFSLAKAFQNGTVVLKGDWQELCKHDLLQKESQPKPIEKP
jgi:hypothetical protein